MLLNWLGQKLITIKNKIPLEFNSTGVVPPKILTQRVQLSETICFSYLSLAVRLFFGHLHNEKLKFS